MNTYDLINPSDPISFTAENDAVAILAVLLVSQNYGASREGFDAGPYLFGTVEDVMRDLRAAGDDSETLSAAMEKRFSAIADALDSFQIVPREGREMYDEALGLLRRYCSAEAEAWKAKWLDQKQSSLNDICSYAWRKAAALRARLAEKG